MSIATLRYRRAALPAARQLAALVALLVAVAASGSPPRAADSLPDVVERTQPKIVKLYGAGGFKGLHSYQTGMLISPDGHVLTVYSYVLDTNYVTAVAHDGRRFDAKLVGADPRLEIAVLKMDAEDMPHFNLDEAAEAEPGTRVLGLSNLFGVAMGNEPASVQRGVIAAKTALQARRGQFETVYRGPVYILDVTTNNPGAAGGSLVTLQGRLLGMLGKELRNAQNHTWLNYALPAAEVRESVRRILSGVMTPPGANPDATRPELAYSLNALGVRLVPDVLDRTPPFVEWVRPGSPADRAGVRPDDLVLLLGDQLIQSCAVFRDELAYIALGDEIRLTILRGDETPELSEVVLKVEPNDAGSAP